jgi:hypothetical protein
MSEASCETPINYAIENRWLNKPTNKHADNIADTILTVLLPQ